jgi:hypothetical protein
MHGGVSLTTSNIAMAYSSHNILSPSEPSQIEMEAVMEKASLGSAPHDETDPYSEWRLFLWVSRFDHVEVNGGFQIRDFQTSEGTSIISDPAPYRKLQKEASAIWTTYSRKQTALFVVLYIGWFFFVLLLLQLLTVAAMVVASVVCLALLFAGLFLVILSLRTHADSRITAMVDSYKEHFLNAYGIELGYGKLHPTAGWWPNGLVRAIYLRRPRRLVGGEVLEAGDFEVQDHGGRMPPIFINPTLPGDIHVNEKVHHASMKVDSETWALLQSVHQKMVQTPPIFGLLVAFYVVTYFIWYFFGGRLQTVILHPFVYAYFPPAILLACIHVTRCIIDGALEYRNLRVYEKVARRVNEALKKDANRSHLAVEFHTSDLPGRDKTDSRRYQFVTSNRSPKKEIV